MWLLGVWLLLEVLRAQVSKRGSGDGEGDWRHVTAGPGSEAGCLSRSAWRVPDPLASRVMQQELGQGASFLARWRLAVKGGSGGLKEVNRRPGCRREGCCFPHIQKRRAEEPIQSQGDVSVSVGSRDRGLPALDGGFVL